MSAYVDHKRVKRFIDCLDGAVPLKHGFRSGYWGTYSRILSEPGYKTDPALPRGMTVEVDLTPINGWPSDYREQSVAVSRLRSINIREHCTTRSKSSDAYVNRLPRVQYELMLEHLGEEITNRLLTEDFLPLIDWQKYRQHCNGGCPLALCLKAGVPTLPQPTP